ncbi:TetR/AcrR family transcriptional regulator [Paenibacillus antri]|uniref:TetR/AcrR family transcriptional regulator n=1 Tax=Paenibacillus antri TaxID=2582848 RepID=A0A5R9GMH6_9BACL|nr:TetR/AcrR family transcriptional regulator [Paenibacillus antri]TLS53155.1 TetR/AcrR family transcriptional regulator [Paenibacillus antri]
MDRPEKDDAERRAQERWLEELLRAAEDDRPKMTDKQARIVNAAIEIFAEKGYSAASTSEIATKAGVAEGTIFRHYKTKKELLFSIVSPLVAKLVAPLVLKDFFKVLEAPYPNYESFLRAVIRNRSDFARKHLPALRILLQEIPFHPELREPYKDLVVEGVLPRIRRTVERFQAEGALRADFPSDAVIRLTVTSAVGFLFVRHILLPDYPWDEDAETERTIDFLMHGLAGPRE